MGKKNRPMNSRRLRQELIVKELSNGCGCGYYFKENGRITTDYIGILGRFDMFMCELALIIMYYFCIKKT